MYADSTLAFVFRMRCLGDRFRHVAYTKNTENHDIKTLRLKVRIEHESSTPAHSLTTGQI